LEELPRGLADLLEGPQPDSGLFGSPVRVYRLLIDLSELSRRHAGTGSAFSAYAARRGWLPGLRGEHIRTWAGRHRFPSVPAARNCAQPDGLPAVEVARLRQTAVERTRRPVSHTRATMNDHYLARSPGVHRDSRVVVGEALRGEVAKARAVAAVPVFTRALLARFAADPEQVAAETGLDMATLRQMIGGGQDTAVVACTDRLSGPYTPPGQPCTASFLACLDCRNARALPHHLPAQLAMAEQTQALRPHLDPAAWQARYQPRLHQLQDILTAHTTGELDQARSAVSTGHRRLAGQVLAGDWDLR
jgi:hypothetical protein